MPKCIGLTGFLALVTGVTRNPDHTLSVRCADHNQTGALATRLDLLDDEPFQLPRFTPLGEHIVELHRAVRVLLQETWSVIFSFAVVIPRRTDVPDTQPWGVGRSLAYPLSLYLRGRLYGLGRARVHLRDDIGKWLACPFSI